MIELDLTLQSVQTLANGASVLRFKCHNASAAHPGDRLRLMGGELAIMRSADDWLELWLPAEQDAALFSKANYRADLLDGGRLPLCSAPGVLVVADEAGFAAAIHLAQRDLRQHQQVLLLLELSASLPFAARPSQYVVANMLPGVIAAAPLLEDWGLASRIACQDFLPGCHQGGVEELVEHYLPGQSTDLQLLAFGSEMLRQRLQPLGDWQFSLQN
jgi:hypothetical protein